MQNQHNSIWISANAGSGKTTFLTRRLVTLLLQGVLPERICCITYTKAAANEMQTRVLATLRELLLADDATCAKQVSGLLGRQATSDDIARARSLFGLVLDSASGLQLTTIHGFCQNILRRFPIEAGIAPHFTLLDDIGERRLLQRSKHRLLSDYASGDPALDAALDLIGSRTSEGRFDDYITAIVRNRRHWDTLWRGQTPESLRAHLLGFHGLPEDATEASLAQNFCQKIYPQDLEVMRAYLPQLLRHKNKAEQEMGRIFALWLEADAPQRLALLDEFCGLFCTTANEIRKRLLNEKDFPQGSPLRTLCERLAEDAVCLRRQRAALPCVEESMAVALLASALLTLYAQAKTTIHALDYDDLIGEVRKLFANPAMLGWVMSKLDHRIDHLLIDEAQDTSSEQWQIAHALVEELIAATQGIGSGDTPRSLLVVGDEKQSIYSFQGAAPELFYAKHGDFEQLLSESAAPLAFQPLKKSYRSAEAILTIVDAVASLSHVASALSSDGNPEQHELVRHEAAGRVTLYPLIEAPERAAQPPLTIPTDYALTQSGPERLAETIAAELEGWFQNGRMLESEWRPLAYGDVLILVYRRNPLVLPLIRALQRRAIPVAGIDRLTLSTHLAVRDLLALIRWVLNPADDLALAHALRSPLIGWSDEQLRVACIGRSGTLWASIGGHPLLERALNNGKCTPYEFLTDLLETGDARRRFAGRFGEEVHEVFDELKAQAASMPAELAPTLSYFHDWISRSEREIKREQESGKIDQVRIMTVHGAKGLEAPVVLLIDTVRLPDTRHEIVYFPKSAQGQTFPVLAISDEAKAAARFTGAKDSKRDALLAEYHRLLYVALTRARDELHLFGLKGAPEQSWYDSTATALRQCGAVEKEGRLILSDERPVATPKERLASHTDSPPLPVWASTPPAMKPTRARIASPSQLAPSEIISPYAQSGGADARSRGVQIHRILECLSPDDDVPSLRRLIPLIAPEWSEEAQASVANRIAALLASHRWLWEAPAHAEVNISGTLNIEGRAIPIAGQIDRLVETADAFILLDYKTGQHVPDSAEAVSLTYRLQLKAYHALVSELYPMKPVRCAIVWTASPTLMWCDEAVAATLWPNEFVIEQPMLVA